MLKDFDTHSPHKAKKGDDGIRTHDEGFANISHI